MAAADIVTTVGKGLISAALVASTIKYLGWGTSTTTAAAGDTNLGTASNEARVTGTQSQQTTTTTNDTFQVVGTITSASTQTINEMGVFDAAGTGTPPSGGNLFAHHSFGTGVGVVSGDSIAFTNKYKAA